MAPSTSPSRAALKASLRSRRAEAKNKERARRLALVAEVRKRPIIWDKHFPGKRQRVAMDGAWDEVAQATQRPKDWCRKVWKNLLDHFRNLYNESMCGKRCVGAEDTPHICGVKWPFYSSLMFLKAVVGMREDYRSVGNVGKPSCSNDEANLTNFDYTIVQETDTTTICNLEEECKSNQDILHVQVTAPDAELTVNQDSTKLRAEGDLDVNVTLQPSNISSGFPQQEDSVSIFCKYLGDIMRQIRPHLRRKCELEIIRLANSYGEGEC